MAIGIKSGGRAKGTPNKRSTEVAELLQAIGCEPVEGMARIAMDEAQAPELRGRMYAELTGYLFPKRKALEVRDEGRQVTFNINTKFIAPAVLMPEALSLK